MITWLTSDLHLNHDREFIYGPRGFKSVEEMNEVILSNITNTVHKDDDLYILGDLMLGDSEKGIEMIKSINCNIHVIRGNHDTDTRIDLYRQCPNIVEVADAKFLKCGKMHFYLSHFPCVTGSLENKDISQMTCNFFGHTHQKGKFYEDRPYMYNVAVDAHNNKPVGIDTAIYDMLRKVDECCELL